MDTPKRHAHTHINIEANNGTHTDTHTLYDILPSQHNQFKAKCAAFPKQIK